MKKGTSKKKAKANAGGPMSSDAFSALFDWVVGEVNAPKGRLAASSMPEPANTSKKSWYSRVKDPSCPVFQTLKEYMSHSGAGPNDFVDALWRHGIADRRAVVDGDDPENAVDGRCVLALLFAYYLSMHSEHIGNLFQTYPSPGTVDYDGLWFSVEVLSVPEGEEMPPLQRSIDNLIRSSHIKQLRNGEVTKADAAEPIGDVCYEVYRALTIADDPITVKKDVLALVYYLDGLAPRSTAAQVAVEDAPQPTTVIPEIVPNLMDFTPELLPPKEEEMLVVAQPAEVPSWSVREEVVAAPSWSRRDEPIIFDDEEAAFGARLRFAVDATKDRKKWMT